MRKLKKAWNRHWNCLPWFVCGLSILIQGDIGRWAYGLAWVTILVMTWHYCPTIGMKEFEEKLEDKENE